MMTEQTAEEAASRGRFPLRWWSVIVSLAMVAGVFASIAFAPERSYPAFSEPLETGVKVERDLTVTELTVDPVSHAFLTENGCERYFKYNKDLLLDHRKAALQQELSAEQRRHGGV